ncbi:rhamnan synthesis F family protein [Desulforhopalus singaporensis]|uniref:Uncharacterized protein n=1 Tax=Desulforhopalus singaporensis TaxID=91360 RepID=A0A1H0TX29_9BACT|nr:rhamnan synthesis F family protein [Desulforhopalus singaporensis]SDP58441.1 hypothetical protein SAMN05660330_03269 [Desulforhopalus singaporensis]
MSFLKSNKAVIVLGMHRSGTSALTAGLTALGFNFGHLAEHKSIENPKGYFENQGVVQLNERILNHLGYSWSNPFVIGIGDLAEITDQFYVEASNLLQSNYQDCPLWGIKDPRVSLLLPFWKRVVRETFNDTEVYYVHALRSPVEVAESLRVRSEKFQQFLCGDTEQSLLLWFAYHFHALKNVKGEQNILVSFEDLLNDPAKQLKRLSAFLGVCPDPTSVDEYCDSFLEKKLKHHSSLSIAIKEDYRDYLFIDDFFRNLLGLTASNSFGSSQIKSIVSDLPDLRYLHTCARVGGAVFQDLDSARRQLQATIKEAEVLARQVQYTDEMEQHVSGLESKLGNSENQLHETVSKLKASRLEHAIIKAEHERVVNGTVYRFVAAAGNAVKKNSVFSWILERLLGRKNYWSTSGALRLINASNSFDRKYYCDHTPGVAEKGVDPVRHFLTQGWKQGVRPNRFFDPLYYIEAYPDVAATGLNPLVHYIIAGEREGRRTEDSASDTTTHKQISVSDRQQNFDPEFYQKAYSDVGGSDPYYHYLHYGKKEGRLANAAQQHACVGVDKLAKNRKTVIVVTHDASRTGGPMLTLKIIEQLKKRFNIIGILLHGGELVEEYKNKCDVTIGVPESGTEYLIGAIVGQVAAHTAVSFAIANTIESRYVLPVLAKIFIPALCLIHEFASYVRPVGAIAEANLWAARLIFSTEIVYKNAVEHCPDVAGDQPLILPQGRSAQPLDRNRDELQQEGTRVKNLMRPGSDPEGTVVVLGGGTVELRKGVDLFISCAAAILQRYPEKAFRFVWAGKGFVPDTDTDYSVYLNDQIVRSGLQDHVVFLGELKDVTLAYELADLYFLSSRLDPLPNSAIDAMFYRLPVVCFANTTGIAEILKKKKLTRECVVSYLNVEQAADVCGRLCFDPDYRKLVGMSVEELAMSTFDMETYVESLVRIGEKCEIEARREEQDCRCIREEKAMDPDFYNSPFGKKKSLEECAVHFVKSWRDGNGSRKPFPGFHPGIYLQHHGVSPGGNPLADFLRQGRPAGPWLTEIIRPDFQGPQDFGNFTEKAALHIHVFYDDLFETIWSTLSALDFPLDLLLSVVSPSVAAKLAGVTAGYTNGRVDIRVVPNRGRDIGPLLTEFNRKIVENYSIIGHLHTKKTLDISESAVGRIWFEFLLENLLGIKKQMARIIVGRMANDPSIGLVFPDDPHAVGWDENKKIASEMAGKIGISAGMDRCFNFPVGTMFWARTDAIMPLFQQNFTWDCYPREPLPYDGTMLHALERILPFVVKQTGYRSVVTHVPGVTR